jgi:predicted nuclease of predicted toxin-antitoxin system
MRILLDECLPRRLKKELAGHDVQTVPEAGWAGKSNGELIRLAEGKFDVFITIDRNLVAQRILTRLSFAVVILIARSNRLDDVKPLIPRVLEVLQTIRPGQVVRVGG